MVWISSTISFKPLFMGLRKYFLLKTSIFYATRGFTDPSNVNIVFRAFNNVYISQKPSKEFEWTIINTSGDKRHLEASVSLMKNLEGLPIGFRGIVRDVSERKRADEKIHKLKGSPRQMDPQLENTEGLD